MPDIEITKDWHASSDILVEHNHWNRILVDSYHLRHPGEKVNITAAHREGAELLGLPPDYFRRRNTLTPDGIRENLYGVFACDDCNGPMAFEFTPGCESLNPARYTGMFFCKDQDCGYHFYTTEGLVDVVNKVKDDEAHTITRVLPEGGE